MGSSNKKIISSLSVAALVAGTLVVAPGVAQAGVGSTPRVLINEVYGGGGNSGATYTRDFIELYNGTDAAVDLAGWSVQYASAAGSSWQITPLTGVIQPAGYYLIGEAAGSGGSTPITPDADGSIAMSGTSGKVALVNSATGLSCAAACSGTDTVVDFVGYGAANESAGGVPTPAASNINSVSRNASHANTAVNGADFTVGAPTPTNAGTTPQDVGEKTIAEVQGTGEASPFVTNIATVQGVVTAAYPTGGYNGFVIQTAGTGGAIDPTSSHTASDAIFVYSSGTNTVDAVAIGDEVRVSGLISEFSGLTEITPAAAADVTVVGTGSVTAAEAKWPATAAPRESLESMLYQPFGDFTVTNTFATNRFGEVGLAVGDSPLIQPTDAFAPGTKEAADVAADNAARGVVLDDGAGVDFTAAANTDQTPPYVSLTDPVRVGEPVTFTDTVIVDYRNGAWKLNPTAQVTPGGPLPAPAEFKNNRADAPDAAAIAVNGAPDVTIASFNVLNYFTTLGVDVAGCTAFKDRDGNGIAVDSCTGDNGPRGAWDAASLQRQQAKIVTAINGLGAAVVGLSEIENSAVLGGTPDAALSTLVGALNVAAGPGTWAYVPSAADLPPVGEMDVITNAIIYQPAKVDRTGDAHALGTESAIGEPFDNAREPISQVFTPKGGAPFLFVMNHFKSKGSAGTSPGDADSGDGQGASNGSRVRQATALRDWIPSVKGTAAAVALVGDFNSYGMEDPLRLLYEAGYADAEQHFKLDKSSYSFSGLSGSLDHILINHDAVGRATGADIWNINSGESLALQYSRYNYHGTLFYDERAFASSDHDPVVLGLTKGAAPTTTVQILGINDFHGRIKSNGVEAGAAVLAGAVGQLRTQHPDTVFAAAGDLIGASTFESFIAQDKPTLDALNAAGLQVSAVGNHEFDQGFDDLTNRIMKPYDATTNPFGGASWQYLGANVRNAADDSAALPESWVQNFGDVQVGFVGAVTDHLPELVSPAGIAGLTIESPVVAANRVADQLKADGADIVVLLVHEGAATTELSSATDPASDMGRIVNGADESIDAIISGHTHLAYNHAIPVPQWAAEGRPVTTRPVVSAGQYGNNLNQLLFSVDPDSGVVQSVTQNILPLTTTSTATPPVTTPNYPADPAVQTIVDRAVTNAAVLGAVELGQITGPFNRAKLANGSTENRGGESTLGNLVADAQRAATASPEAGEAHIAFMNPGGLRQDMVGNPGNYPVALTYQQAAVVQPFANTLVNMRLTGAQIRTALEQQWQPTGAARPFLRLGISKGFSYTYDPLAAAGSRITTMALNGEPVTDAATYSVTVNSFLASGGDNFGAFATGTAKKDTGQTDLQAMVDYMADNTPVAVDYTQRSVGVSFPAGAPAQYAPGDTVTFALSSLAFSTAADTKDALVNLSLNGVQLGTAAVDNTIGTEIFDEYGKAAVSFMLPLDAKPGDLTITGATTGTSVVVPLKITVPAPVVTVTLAASGTGQIYGSPNTVTFTATVESTDGAPVVGLVEFRNGDAVLGSAPVAGRVATYRLPAATPAGSLTVTASYPGAAPSAPITITVAKATSQAILLTTTTSYRQGAFLPAILIGGVVLNNGQQAKGDLQLISGGKVLATVPLTYGVGITALPRSLPKGTYQIVATFRPADSVNVDGVNSNTIQIRLR